MIDPAISDEQIVAQLAAKPLNSFAAFPCTDTLAGKFFEFDVRCRGEINPHTGYFLNIKDIDTAVRRSLIRPVTNAVRSQLSPFITIAKLFQSLRRELLEHQTATRATPESAPSPPPVSPPNLSEPLRSLAWNLSPYNRLEASMSPDGLVRVAIRQQFDFSAAHRLHADSLSDEQNQSIFGKCNNANGHGHNYRIEPCVEVLAGRPESLADRPPATHTFSLSDLERITAQTIIDRFDHKHLNHDTAEFDTRRGGLNPSVENIALVCFQLLEPHIAAFARSDPSGPSQQRLRSVTVWETPKTSATYPAM